jgi:hypothetical protein
LVPLLAALVDQAPVGTALTCEIAETTAGVELKLGVEVASPPEGPPRPLEEWKASGDSLSLTAVVVGALGGLATVERGPGDTLRVHLILETYRP